MVARIWAAGLAAAFGLWPFAVSYGGSLDRLTGYAELRFGLSLDEASALTGAAPSAAEGGGLLIETKETMVGRPVQRQLWFRDGKLSRIVFHWAAEDRADPELCEALFTELAEAVAGRYAKPAQGPTALPAGKEFTGGAFWVFPDGNNIGLSVAYGAAGSGTKACRAMLSYRAAPADGAGGD